MSRHLLATASLALLLLLPASFGSLVPGLRITVAVKETAPAFTTGGVLAAAYTLDNRTQDAFAFVGQRQ